MHMCTLQVIRVKDYFHSVIMTFPTIVVAPGSFRYTGITSNSITFQWNGLTVIGIEVSWYVTTCSEGNSSFIVSCY